MFNEATFRDMGEMAGRSISRKVVSLSILAHDMINIIFMISRLCIQKVSKFSSFSTVLLSEVIDSHPKKFEIRPFYKDDSLSGKFKKPV